jgi:hypothetical protein
VIPLVRLFIKSLLDLRNSGLGEILSFPPHDAAYSISLLIFSGGLGIPSFPPHDAEIRISLFRDDCFYN